MMNIIWEPDLYRSTLSSDVPFGRGETTTHGVVEMTHNVTNQVQYVWITDLDLWPQAGPLFVQGDYGSFRFTPFTSVLAWNSIHGDTRPLHNQNIDTTHFPPPASDADTHDAEEVTQDSFASIFTAATQQTGTGNQGGSTQGGSSDSTLLFAQVMAQMFDRLDKRDAERARAQREQETRRDLAQAQREQTFLRGFQAMQSSAGSTASALKAPSFPTFSGKASDIPLFLEQLETIKSHPFFHGCTWDVMDPTKTVESNHIRMELLEKLPMDYKYMFVDAVEYKNDGFAMVRDLIVNLRPAGTQNKLLSMAAFANLAREPNETEAALFARARSLKTSLTGVLAEDLMPIKMLTVLENSYPNLVERYLQNDSRVVNAGLNELEALMLAERTAATMFPSRAPDSQFSANRATNSKTPAASPSPAPADPNDPKRRQPPPDWLNLPRDWRHITKTIKEGERCVVCNSKVPHHVKNHACVPLAQAGLILVEDPVKSQAIVDEWKEEKKKNPRTRDRRGKASANNVTSDSPASAPAPTPSPPGEDTASGRRATSSDRKLPQIDLNPNYNKFSALDNARDRLIDKERDSDSDDDALFDGDCLLSDDFNPSNASATDYVVASARHTVYSTSCN
jgi:hypothetical protein